METEPTGSKRVLIPTLLRRSVVIIKKAAPPEDTSPAQAVTGFPDGDIKRNLK